MFLAIGLMIGLSFGIVWQLVMIVRESREYRRPRRTI